MHPSRKISPPQFAPRLALAAIGFGLMILSAAMIWRVPPIAGMALVVLGATAATVERYRHSPLLRPIVAVHATTYGALYALFLGATFQPPLGAALRIVEVADLAVSLGLLVASAILLASAWRRSEKAF